MAPKVRLDLHLLTKGLVPSRQQANKLIRAGNVRSLAGEVLDKPGLEVKDDLEVSVKKFPRFVSRGGEKLIAAFNTFPINVDGKVCLDCGISTGGFTDCLLQKGASLVYGVDVGYGQVAWKIRNDKRVVLKERTNVRTLTSDVLYAEKNLWASFVVADLSFISLNLVLPGITGLLRGPKKEGLLLIKPQFEVGREKIGKNGVVRDPEAHIYALSKVINYSKKLGWMPKGLLASPITGPAGNHEYLLWLGIDKANSMPDLRKIVLDTLS